jgi:hypothetical protein
VSFFLCRTVRLLAIAVLAVLGVSPARAAQDIVHFGSAIDVGPNEAVHDTVCFFCSVRVKGNVNGDIVVFFGDVQVEGQANHDVVNFFGEVSASKNSSIGHDLVNFFGEVRLGQNVQVSQDTVVLFGDLRSAESDTFGGSRVIEPARIFWGPVLVIALIIWIAVHEIRQMRFRRHLRGW